MRTSGRNRFKSDIKQSDNKNTEILKAEKYFVLSKTNLITLKKAEILKMDKYCSAKNWSGSYLSRETWLWKSENANKL